MKNISPTRLKTFSFIIVALILVSITVITENLQNNTKGGEVTNNDNYTANQALSQESVASADPESQLYTVREHDGAIAVFQSGISAPIMREKFPVGTLSDQDRALLQKGVQFKTYKDMLAFFENYE